MESSGTAVDSAHVNHRCPSRVPPALAPTALPRCLLCRTLGTPGSCPASAPATLPDCPSCREPWDILGCIHFSFKHTASMASLWRNQGYPWTRPFHLNPSSQGTLYAESCGPPGSQPIQFQLSRQGPLCAESPDYHSPCPLQLWLSHQGSPSTEYPMIPNPQHPQLQPDSQSHRAHTHYTAGDHTQGHSFIFRKSSYSA